MNWKSPVQAWSRRSALKSMLLASLLVLSAPILGQQGTTLPAPGAQEEAEPGPVNQQQALERVRALFDGDIISITEVETEEGETRFRIRMDNEGNIFTVFVDPATGRVSRD